MSGFKKMRILHVIDSLGRGGAERVVVSLATGQRRDGHDVRVVSLMEPSDLAAELVDAGVGVVRLQVGHRRALPYQVAGVSSEIRGFHPDVIHAHLLFSTLATAAVPRALGGRRVTTFHNLGSASMGSSLTGLVARGLLSWVARHRFDELTAVSPAAAAAYQEELGLDVAPKAVPNPVDVEGLRRLAPPSRAAARAALSLSEATPTIVVVAKFKPEKAHDVLIRALAMVAPERRPLVALVGDGPLLGPLRLLAEELGVSRCIRWLGELPMSEVLRWVKASDLLVLPSRAEGFGMVLLEAMALGTPVVATSVGGIPWCVGDAGWLVQPDSPSALANVIREALDDAEARRGRAELATTTQLPQFELRQILKTWYRTFGERKPEGR